MRISPNRSSGIYDLNFYNNFCGVWVSKKASRMRCSWLAEKSHSRFSVNYKICIMNGSFHPVLSGFSLYNTKCKVRKWFQPGSTLIEWSSGCGQVTWLWRWLPHRLSKHQSPTTLLLRTPVTQVIVVNQGTSKLLYSRNVSILKDNLCFCRGKQNHLPPDLDAPRAQVTPGH